MARNEKTAKRFAKFTGWKKRFVKTIKFKVRSFRNKKNSRLTFIIKSNGKNIPSGIKFTMVSSYLIRITLILVESLND